MDIPFEGIATFFLFIIGVPAFVLQFLSSEERRVVLRWQFWAEIMGAVVFAGLLAAGAIWLQAQVNPKENDVWIWGCMYFVLLVLSGLVAFRVSNHYGRREQIIKDLRKRAESKLKKSGQLNEGALSQLISLGKQCESGQEQELVLQALDELVGKVCDSPKYKADLLETVIEETVYLLLSRPQLEDFQSFRTAVQLLSRIVTCNPPEGALSDQQKAVRALSVLCQTVLVQANYSISLDSTLMKYKEALSLAWSIHPQLLMDVTQALSETGAVALDAGRYLFAAAALSELISVSRSTPVLPEEAGDDIVGLLAHFWTARDGPEASSRLFAMDRLANLPWKGEALLSTLDTARRHCQATKEFITADKLSHMAAELKGKALGASGAKVVSSPVLRPGR